MEAPIKTRYDKAGPQVAEALRRRRFEAHYVSTAQEALELALTLIPKDRTVSWGGTATAAQIGLMDRLHQGDYQLIDRDTGKTPAEKQALMRQALTCGTFIMSSNAISADGQLVNIDGNANRVAALCFGPESVLVIAGMNKVMGDLDSAIARARQVAAPPTPSASTSRLPAPLPEAAATAPAPTASAARWSSPGPVVPPAASRSFWWARIWAFKAKRGIHLNTIVFHPESDPAAIQEAAAILRRGAW